ncbi:hypothetical protein SLEP1_g44767 [Rubroshorea leprosula]|uniref:Uncharacterized protein n=1 Tax=Rubroshorea leprosula TaxID=152421 RepID=A0AAV5LH92_9ROSI|nr:hypothetical protein SLEP1_g44767 [Rubroshorea leprosula]
MANWVASTESQADKLANKMNDLKEELEKAQDERDNGIQVAKDEADYAKNHDKRAEVDKDKALFELNSLKKRVAKANQNLTQAVASLEKVKKSYQYFVCIARGQGAKWLVGFEMFQDAVVVASANTMMEIYNEIHGKWELNEEGVLVWPLYVVEEGEDIEGLPNFDAWVIEPLEAEAEPLSTPPSSQLVTAPTLCLPACFAQAQTFPARASVAPTDVSIPLDLTDD